MKISKLLENVGLSKTLETDCEVSGLCFDSRAVKPGDVFVATRGTAVDGHDFIAKAVEQGAVAVVCETLPENPAEGVVYVQIGRAHV